MQEETERGSSKRHCIQREGKPHTEEESLLMPIGEGMHARDRDYRSEEMERNYIGEAGRQA